MPLPLTRPHWKTITDIHWEACRTVDYRYDQDLYGRSEHWAIPDGAKPQGDCEDFALWCSERLIEADISWLDQAVAYCLTETGTGHLVLLINTDRGVYVIDNRQRTVVGYADLAKSYQFIAQSQWGRPMTEAWITISDRV